MAAERDRQNTAGLRAGICDTSSKASESMQQPGDVELNFAVSGEIRRWSFDREVVIPMNRVAVFSTRFTPQARVVSSHASYLWVRLSLHTFMGWRLSTRFKQAILAGEILVDGCEERSSLDHSLVLSWVREANQKGSGNSAWTLLEIEARLGRLADASPAAGWPTPSFQTIPDRNQAAKAARMGSFLIQHFAEQIHWKDVARVAGVSPAPARQCFLNFYGMTPHQYLVQLRLAHAKQLIADAHARIIDIALEAGFPTVSNFYRAFEAEVGQTPSAFRKALGLGSAASNEAV